MYDEIQQLYNYCIKIGVNAQISKLYDGYKIYFPNGNDCIQHKNSHIYADRIEFAKIGKGYDVPIPLDKAKAYVRRHKKELNKLLKV